MRRVGIGPRRCSADRSYGDRHEHDCPPWPGSGGFLDSTPVLGVTDMGRSNFLLGERGRPCLKWGQVGAPPESGSSFDFAQGRLSAPLKCASIHRKSYAVNSAAPTGLIRSLGAAFPGRRSACPGLFSMAPSGSDGAGWSFICIDGQNANRTRRMTCLFL
jgi:hypothetical protein